LFSRTKNGVTMTASEPLPAAPPHKLLWYQYGLRSLLLAFPIVAWCLGTGIRGSVLAAAVIAMVFLLIKRRRWPAFGVFVAILVLSGLGLGDSVEVRLNTGDQRLLFWGVPIRSYRCLRPELRQRLLSLDDSEVPPQWVWCATKVGSNNADIMVFEFYRAVTAWVEIDPEIAKLVVRDIAKYLQTTHATHGLPDCNTMIWPDVVEQADDGRYHVVPNWRKNPEVQWYLRRKGYVLH
jgi:hypothetical protein